MMNMTSRDEFVAQVAATLPEDVTELLNTTAKAMRSYHAAIMNFDDAAADQAWILHRAAVFVMNGRTFFGCRANETSPGKRADRHCAAIPGAVPQWGQMGEFLVVVNGLRAVVKYSAGFGCLDAHFEFHALDRAMPFISETGYRSHFCRAIGGTSVDDAARGIMAAMLAEGRRLGIDQDALTLRKVWPWMSAQEQRPTACAGDNGQYLFCF